ncbi:MAG: hypothetical protein LBV62_01520, partial [Rickettsiales bacterium]|nr:hypothetical protein [Rickettsiales bacterium]
FITNNVDILLLTIAFLNFLMHHFLDKNVLTFSLLFLGKVNLPWVTSSIFFVFVEFTLLSCLFYSLFNPELALLML